MRTHPKAAIYRVSLDDAPGFAAIELPLTILIDAEGKEGARAAGEQTRDHAGWSRPSKQQFALLLPQPELTSF